MTDPHEQSTATLPAPAGEVAAAARSTLGRLAGPGALLRDDQLAAIDALVTHRRRVLVVQRTGWGKSAVYFIATRLLRDAGAGPTLIVSPLLALMRDQIAAAQRAGIRAATINSTNRDDWDAIAASVGADSVDVLLISPERLNNPGFRRDVLPGIAARIGLLVVDEAHCISDWGHDFRPDYRRIRDVLAGLAPDTAVLATTATANDRVTADIAAQLGHEPLTLRGTLDRVSLHLAVVNLREAGGDPARLAWLAAWLPTVVGSGIVYVLTVAEAERVAAWLRSQGVDAIAYTGQTDPVERERIEADLRANSVKAVVATSALGMGFDKPDLRFVVHYGSPSSPIAYYQAIGRAGRAVDRADIVLLPGGGDEAVWAYFDATAFPPKPVVDEVLSQLAAADGPVSVRELEQQVNLRRGRLQALLKILDVDGVAELVPGARGGWRHTGAEYTYDTARYAGIAAARRDEQAAMRAYHDTSGCRMSFLRRQLDDPGADERCGRCDNCAQGDPGRLDLDGSTADAALDFLRASDTPVPPRRQWPAGLDAEHDRRGHLSAGERSEEGRALAFGDDAGWGAALAPLLADDAPVTDELLEGIAALLARWDWAARPTWVTTVPSRAHPRLVTSLSRRIAHLGRLELRDVVTRRSDTPPQGQMRNSVHAADNALRSFAVDPGHDGAGALPPGPCLLVDDTASSGWTLTVVGALLRDAGAEAILPLVLHRRP